MFKRFVVLLVFMAFVIFAASYMTGYITLAPGSLTLAPANSGELMIDLSIITDTEAYHSGEMMEARVAVACNKDLESIIVRLYGVKDRFGSYKINQEEIVEMNAPGEEVVFLASMPSCYGCAGVEPGEYELKVDAIYDGEIYSTTKTITLVK